MEDFHSFIEIKLGLTEGTQFWKITQTVMKLPKIDKC